MKTTLLKYLHDAMIAEPFFDGGVKRWRGSASVGYQKREWKYGVAGIIILSYIRLDNFILSLCLQATYRERHGTG